jgi:tetratricopeptide (TPR) repeat protein
LRNIAALSTARLGDIEGALEAELDIERQLEEFEKPDWHLLYINCLNLARLYRRRKEFDTARAYYTRAFDTMEGARSDSDGLYVNLTFAQLETEAGNLEKARGFWLRAALHWASCEAPEALAWRVATAALGRQVKPGQFVDEEVSAYVTGKLEQAFPGVASGRAMTFTRCVVGEQYSRAIGGDGWGVLLLEAARWPASAGSQHARMRGLLTEILGLGGFEGTVAVPDRHGREMPRGLDELMGAALEYGVDRVEYKRELVEWDRCEAMGGLEARLGPLVSSVTPRGSELEVRFKRYLRAAVLSGSEMRLVAGLGGKRKFVELLQQGYAEDVIRSLEGRRIIEISMEA